ncbi:MAG TPA: hypothetical protein VGE52_00855 [Pirellulales bacterium]
MTISKSDEYWTGSEAGDIKSYLQALSESEGGYPLNAFRVIRCECGNERFRLQGVREIVRRECAACLAPRFTCRSLDDWEEAIEEVEPEAFSCVVCRSDEANVGVAFAGYPEAPQLDAVKWF